MKNTLLQLARERASLTQAQVAKRIGITEQAYQRYEYGTSVPNVRTALRIADALGTTVEEIFSDGQGRSE